MLSTQPLFREESKSPGIGLPYKQWSWIIDVLGLMSPYPEARFVLKLRSLDEADFACFKVGSMRRLATPQSLAVALRSPRDRV